MLLIMNTPEVRQKRKAMPEKELPALPGSTRKYQEISGKYQEIPENTRKYQEISGSTRNKRK